MDSAVECHCCRGIIPRAEACLLGGAYYCLLCSILLDHGQAERPLCPVHRADARPELAAQ